MTSRIGSSRHHVVIAGGGIAGLEALIALRMQAPERFDVTLLSPNDTFGYRPLGIEDLSVSLVGGVEVMCYRLPSG